LTTFSRLETGLETCLNLTQKLAAVVRESSDALVACDYQRFTGLARQQTQLSADFRLQEQYLHGLLAEAARELSLQGVVTLGRILEAMAPGSPEGAARIQGISRELRLSSSELDEAIMTNAALLRNLDSYTRVIFKLLLGFEEHSGYGPPMQQPAAAVGRHLVDRKV
jgi:hypothetical protein